MNVGRARAALIVALTGIATVAFTVVGGVGTPARSEAPPPAVASARAAGGSLQTIPGYRALDTRSGTGGPAGAVGPHRTVSLVVAGHGGVPRAGVASVVLTLTATQGSVGGHVVAFAAGTAQPSTSNLNYGPDRTTANLVIAQVGSTGRISLNNDSAGTVELVADISGYYRAGAPIAGGWVPVVPARDVDTRVAGGPVPAGTPLTVRVTGNHGVPTTGVSAVAVNVTAVTPVAGGHLNVTPSGSLPDTSSAVSFAPGQTTTNAAIVAVGADGAIAVGNESSASVNVVVDIAGYFTGGRAVFGGQTSVTPFRALDTRTGDGATRAAVAAHASLTVTIGHQGLAPRAAALNVTVIGASGGGYAVVYGSGGPRPGTSTINFAPGTTVAALAVASVGRDGNVVLYNGSPGSVEVVIDVESLYLDAGAALWTASPSSVPSGEVGSQNLVDCPAVGACVAVGGECRSDCLQGQSSYFEVQSGSRWNYVAAPTPGDEPIASLTSLVCPAKGVCFATGWYDVPNGARPFVDRLDAGQWTATELGLPSGIDKSPGAGAIVVSCASTASCVAVGQYSDVAGNGHPFVESLSDETWTVSTLAMPAGTVTADLLDVACPAAGQCVAVGGYSTGAGSHAFSARQAGRTWTVTALRPPAADHGTDDALNHIACPAVHWCQATGYDASNTDYSEDGAFFDQLSGGTWTPTLAPPIAGTNRTFGIAGGISCSSVGHCVAIGNQYSDVLQRAEIDVLAHGRWTAVNPPVPPTAGSPGIGDTTLLAVTCASDTSCVVVGSLAGDQSAIATFDGTRWTADATQVWTGSTSLDDPIFNDVSCASPIVCSIAGQYVIGGEFHPLLDVTSSSVGR